MKKGDVKLHKYNLDKFLYGTQNIKEKKQMKPMRVQMMQKWVKMK